MSSSSTSAEPLEQAAAPQTTPQQAEKIYQEVLSRRTASPSLQAASSLFLAATPPNITPEAHAQILREQETALLKLGTLYRDQQCATIHSPFVCLVSDVGPEMPKALPKSLRFRVHSSCPVPPKIGRAHV